MNWQEFIFGRLTWDALPHEWFTIGGTGAIITGSIAAFIYLTYTKKWTWLWKEWLTSVDPKRVGIMYIIFATVMLFRGGVDAIMIWLQQAMAAGNAPGFLGANHGYLNAAHFQQIFTAHGDIMVFFVTMGFLFGLLNIIVPLQIGARDLAFPFLNTLGFWLYIAGGILINMFFVFGPDFAANGWLSIAPMSELQYSPGIGVDYWIWSLQVSGLGTLIGGINFIVTILKLRAPGMTIWKMPIFTWTALFSMFIVISIFPILTVVIALLNLDRLFGMHFFTANAGGNMMLYSNLIWIWGHPEVYVLILPAYGIYSEIVATFSQKRLYGYYSVIAGNAGVVLFSMLVWLHHFFTMGAGADVNAFFGIMTAFVALPTSVLVFNWIATMFRGKIVFKTPMLWFLGFIGTFTWGGMAGLLMSVPPADFQVHNSLFLIAHFHTMIVGGALFGIFAGITYWFPKITGFTLDEKLGTWAFWLWLIGFFVSFTPLYVLGFMGAPRRMDHYMTTAWQPLFIVSFIGVCIISAGFAVQIWQVVRSIRQRKQHMDTTGDPWNGRTLEWATTSPAPSYNFAVIPTVKDHDAFWEIKQRKNEKLPKYHDLEVPKNTPFGIYISVACFIIGFAMVWHLYWLAVLGIIAAIACTVIRTFDEHSEYEIPAAEVERMEKARGAKLYA